MNKSEREVSRGCEGRGGREKQQRTVVPRFQEGMEPSIKFFFSFLYLSCGNTVGGGETKVPSKMYGHIQKWHSTASQSQNGYLFPLEEFRGALRDAASDTRGVSETDRWTRRPDSHHAADLHCSCSSL